MDDTESAYMLNYFKRLESECPQFFIDITHDGIGWWLPGSDKYLTEDEAETFLIGLCIKALPRHFHDELKGGFGVYELSTPIKIKPSSKSLAVALLMSVGLAHGFGW